MLRKGGGNVDWFIVILLNFSKVGSRLTSQVLNINFNKFLIDGKQVQKALHQLVNNSHSCFSTTTSPPPQKRKKPEKY